jgi:Domain of unknown function (DUF4259)
MGTWGPGIFSNDTACDVRVAYRMALENGLDDQAAQQQVLDEFADVLDDDTWNEGPLVWLALAKTQWQLGRLDNHVKAEALAVIDQGRDLASAVRRRLPYQEGSVFQLPLRDGRSARGLVSQLDPASGLIIAYFFGPAALGAPADPHGAAVASPPGAHRPLPRRPPAPAPLAGAREGEARRLGVLAPAAIRRAPEHGQLRWYRLSDAAAPRGDAV